MNKIIIIAVVVMLACLLLLCSCQNTTEVVHAEDDYYYSKTSRTSLLYWTRAAKIDHQTPFTKTVVDTIETKPDPNSIDAAGGAAGKLVNTAVKGF